MFRVLLKKEFITHEYDTAAWLFVRKRATLILNI